MKEMAAGLLAGGEAGALRRAAEARLLRAGFTDIDYLDLRACEDLALMNHADRPARLLAAAWLAGVRLIDNIAVG